MKKKRFIIKITIWVLVIIWMGVIFTLSSQPAKLSNQTSKNVATRIIETVPKTKQLQAQQKKQIIQKINHHVRKAAHSIIYFVLAILVMLALNATTIPRRQRWLWAIFICATYALMDEIHQLFVVGRGCELRDVGIDLIGAVLGLVVVEGIRGIGWKVGSRRKTVGK